MSRRILRYVFHYLIPIDNKNLQNNTSPPTQATPDHNKTSPMQHVEHRDQTAVVIRGAGHHAHFFSLHAPPPEPRRIFRSTLLHSSSINTRYQLVDLHTTTSQPPRRVRFEGVTVCSPHKKTVLQVFTYIHRPV